MDRVIDLQFGRDEFACHILVELYAQGNIILTDENYVVLSLLRSHTFDEAAKTNGDGPVRCTIREKYPFTAAANQTEDNIITDPVVIAKMIDDQAKEIEAQNAPKEEPDADAKDGDNNKNKGKGGGGKGGKP